MKISMCQVDSAFNLLPGLVFNLKINLKPIFRGMDSFSGPQSETRRISCNENWARHGPLQIFLAATDIDVPHCDYSESLVMPFIYSQN